MNLFSRSLLIAFPLLALSACTSYYPTPTTTLDIVKSVTLPDALSETSGLYCEGEALFSLNDSGNAPVIFEISHDGKVINESKLALTNFDWEAISADKEWFYIADVGNNKGLRDEVSIYKVRRENLSEVQTLALQYAGNDPASNRAYAHDYDSEAMVETVDALILFSKSWRTGITHIYDISDEPKQTLTPIAQIKNLPGVVTGADYDKHRNVFVVTGYKSDPFGNFTTFIAQVSTDYSVLNVWPLKPFKQVEGVCVDESGDYWFSEEATEGRQATLNRARLE